MDPMHISTCGFTGLFSWFPWIRPGLAHVFVEKPLAIVGVRSLLRSSGPVNHVKTLQTMVVTLGI